MQILQSFFTGAALRHVSIFYLHRVLTLAFPLLLLPVLAHKLSVTALGNFFVLQAWGLMLTYIIDFGFAAHGARAMAQHDDAAQRHNEISKIITAQLLLLAILLPSFLLLSTTLPVLSQNLSSSFFAILLATATAITPNWYFLGREKLLGYVVLDITSRLLTITLIFFITYDDHDFIWPYAIIACTQSITCLASLWLVMRDATIKPSNLPDTISALQHNWRLFISETGLAISVSLNTILLSLFAAPALIAAYGVAEKIIRGCAGLLSALTQALYPHFTQMQKEHTMSARQLLTWGMISNGGLTIAATLGIYFLGPVIMPYLAKADPALAQTLSLWQLPMLFLFGLQTTLYMHGLLAQHQDTAVFNVTWIGLTIYALLGITGIWMQSMVMIIFAQTSSLLGMIISSIITLQKKTPAV
jgi:PST family polysaccharide transporter